MTHSLVEHVRTVLIKVGRIQTVIVMVLIYFLFFGPMAILYQFFHLSKNKRFNSYWIKRNDIDDIDLYLKRQF